MAVAKLEDGVIQISNGDLEALKKISREYGLSDESDVVVFAIGVLSRANGRAVSIEQEDGSVIKFVPSAKLREKQS